MDDLLKTRIANEPRAETATTLRQAPPLRLGDEEFQAFLAAVRAAIATQSHFGRVLTAALTPLLNEIAAAYRALPRSVKIAIGDRRRRNRYG
jgi:hypothetical protein